MYMTQKNTNKQINLFLQLCPFNSESKNYTFEESNMKNILEGTLECIEKKKKKH